MSRAYKGNYVRAVEKTLCVANVGDIHYSFSFAFPMFGHIALLIMIYRLGIVCLYNNESVESDGFDHSHYLILYDYLPNLLNDDQDSDKYHANHVLFLA